MCTAADAILIKNVHIASPDAASNAVGERTNILIKKGTILAVAPEISSDDAWQIDGLNMVAMCGLIDTHRHLWQTVLRGAAANWSAIEYLDNVRSRYSTAMTPEDVYESTLLGVLEALDAGTTTVCDYCHIVLTNEHAEAALQALVDSGIRAVLSYGMFNIESPLSTYHSHAEKIIGAKAFLRGLLGRPGGLIKAGLALNELALISDEQLAEEIELLREFDLVGTVHIGAAAPGGIRRLDRLKLLDRPFVFVHCNRLHDDELRQIVGLGHTVAVTPEAELQMGMGLPVTHRITALGSNPTFGVDVVSSGGGDMWAQLRLGLQVARALQNQELVSRGLSPSTLGLSTGNLLDYATRTAAKALRFANLGAIEPGYHADLILLRTDSVRLAGGVRLGHELLLQASAADVDSVFIGGRPVKLRGTLVGHDLHSRLNRFKDRSQRIFRDAASISVRPRGNDFGFSPRGIDAN